MRAVLPTLGALAAVAAPAAAQAGDADPGNLLTWTLPVLVASFFLLVAYLVAIRRGPRRDAWRVGRARRVRAIPVAAVGVALAFVGLLLTTALYAPDPWIPRPLAWAGLVAALVGIVLALAAPMISVAKREARER